MRLEGRKPFVAQGQLSVGVMSQAPVSIPQPWFLVNEDVPKNLECPVIKN